MLQLLASGRGTDRPFAALQKFVSYRRQTCRAGEPTRLRAVDPCEKFDARHAATSNSDSMVCARTAACSPKSMPAPGSGGSQSLGASTPSFQAHKKYRGETYRGAAGGLRGLPFRNEGTRAVDIIAPQCRREPLRDRAFAPDRRAPKQQ